MATSANDQTRELTEDDIEAVSGGVIAIIRPEAAAETMKPAGLDRFNALLPYIEQR